MKTLDTYLLNLFIRLGRFLKDVGIAILIAIIFVLAVIGFGHICEEFSNDNNKPNIIQKP